MSKLFVQSTEMSNTKFMTTRAKRRCGEIPGQERHSGRAAKRITYFEKVRNEKKMFYKGGKEYGPDGQTNKSQMMPMTAQGKYKDISA